MWSFTNEYWKDSDGLSFADQHTSRASSQKFKSEKYLILTGMS